MCKLNTQRGHWFLFALIFFFFFGIPDSGCRWLPRLAFAASSDYELSAGREAEKKRQRTIFPNLKLDAGPDPERGGGGGEAKEGRRWW